MGKAYFENSVMSTEISRYLFHRYPDTHLRETDSIRWRKNKITSLYNLRDEPERT